MAAKIRRKRNTVPENIPDWWHSVYPVKVRMRRHHLPYRGQAEPDFPKPHPQVRHLADERLRDRLTMLFFQLAGITVFILGTFVSRGDTQNIKGMAFLIVGVFLFLISMAVGDGAKRINPYRPEIDRDISQEKDRDPDRS